jgi:hypothetical protein
MVHPRPAATLPHYRHQKGCPLVLTFEKDLRRIILLGAKVASRSWAPLRGGRSRRGAPAELYVGLVKYSLGRASGPASGDVVYGQWCP